MAIKDKIISWFIRNATMPRLEIIDHAGFIAMKPSISGQIHLRQILMPESVLVDLENQIVDKYGDESRKVLYSIGKKFGYRVSGMMAIPTVDRYTKKEFLAFAYFLVRFVECTYSSNLSHRINLKSSEFDLTMDEYVVCRKNGKGYIMTEGGLGGIWAYVMCDPSIEAIQTKCQGRDDEKCEVICAPPEILEKKGLKFFRETNLDDLKIDPMYGDFNKIREPQYAKNSFEDLINIRFFDYSKGVVKHKGERYFLCEASLIYLIELELKKLEDGTKLLFNCAFDHGKQISELQGKCDCQEFIMQFLSASGWGDILILKSEGGYKVTSYYFPWTKFANDVKFEMYRGLISGLLSGCLNKRIVLDNVDIDTLGDGLTVILS